MNHRGFLRFSLPAMMGVLILGMLITACGGGSTASGGGSGSCSSPPPLAKKAHYRIGFSQEVNNAPWRIAETTSIEEEASKNGDTVIYTDAQNSDSVAQPLSPTVLSRDPGSTPSRSSKLLFPPGSKRKCGLSHSRQIFV